MASDNFLKIDGIEGESTDDKHKNWIEILSYNWGVSQQSSGADRSATGAGSSSRADFQDLSIVKTMDKASPKIFLACAKGDTIKEVSLQLCRAAGSKQTYMEFKLSDAHITSVNLGGGGGGEPSESLTFSFGKMEQTYTKIGLDDKAAGNVGMKWDLTANKGD